LNNLYIADFAPFFIPDILLEGIATGDFTVSHPLVSLHVEGHLKASQFRINDDSIGTVLAGATYYRKDEVIQCDVHKTDNTERNFAMKLLVVLGNNKAMKVIFNLHNTNISVLNSFIKGYVSNLNGKATWKVQLGGSKTNPEITGAI